MAEDEDISGLLEPLLNGAFEEPLWHGFLERCRLRMEADYTSLIFRPPAPLRPSLVHLFAGTAAPPLVENLYRESLHLRDPVDYHQLEDGRVYAFDELVMLDDPAHEQFRRELLTPSGMNDIRMMRVIEPSGVSVWLSLSRRRGVFEARHGRMIGALAAFLRSALRCFVALERERFSASLASEVIRRLNFGWLTLDRDGHVLDADAQGRRMLDQPGVLRLGPGGRLTARESGLDRDIAGAIKTVAAAPQGRPRAIVLSRDPWFDMLLVPAHRRPIPGNPAPAVIAYLHGDDWTSADRCEQLAELFLLLPSEARLALALSRGMTIAEAARELGLTVETARSYSKKIFAKTGARGQPDLVRFIHRSVLTIA
jgi:DNA-binding CsgD family transcriptional regulator